MAESLTKLDIMTNHTLKTFGYSGRRVRLLQAKFLTGRGLTIAANAALTKWLSVFAGPIGWAVTALWTVIDIAGPAYRVTIPAVIQIAYMRQKPRYAGLLTA